MAECTLKHIPAAVWNTVSLQTLDISRNKVGYIVSEIGNLTDIQHLRLSQMDLDTLPPEIGFCDKLQTIDLTGNPIDNLPETLVECRQLYEFKINYKTFYKLLDNYMLQLIDEGKIRSEHIPNVIFELENLEILDLNQTKLNFIPNEHTLINLNELYLSNNSFFNIPESICTMEQLKLLDLSYNHLENIPEYFIKIKRLETLILSYNNLTILSNKITRLSTLIKLIVNHNKINTIENEFSQNQSLLILDLSYNNLKILPEDLCNLKQLETLDLRYNQLEYLPLSIRQMKGLKSMNRFDEDFQRIGLHLLGNPINDPPSYIWKSTSIQTLFDYIENKNKILSNSFSHIKLILIGPKNIGKTSLTIKILNNHKLISNTQKTLDTYVTTLQENQLKLFEQNAQEEYGDHPRSSDLTSSSVLTDQWIENRVSTTSGEYFLNRTPKVKRIYPPPLKTYRSNELVEYFINKSILITKNNLFSTIFDIKSERNFEILYPLIYDSNALFILPVNLTILLNIIQVGTSLDQLSTIDYDALLTNDWLYYSIYRYIESISDHCQQVSIAIIGLILNCQIGSNDQQQQLLDEINSRVNMFLINEEYQRKNITLYSEFFFEPIHLDDDDQISEVIDKLENIAKEWNIKHHKKKRHVLKRRLGFIEQDSLIIDYETCLKQFEQPYSLFDDDDETEELLENEINQMNLNECLDYLKLTGDIICFGQNPHITILLKPYYLLNNILSRTIFRPNIDQWLNYDDNMIFRFSGYYRTQELFDIDRQRLLTRGEYTWKMLNVLFFEQNNDDHCLVQQNIIDYCRLMEYLYLGYLNESNINCNKIKKKKNFFFFYIFIF
jgi:Leucine-rich repeat (LRR) protein